MKSEFNKFNSIPFIEYFKSKNGFDAIIDENKIEIIEANGNSSSVVYFSANLRHMPILEDLLDNSAAATKSYYVYVDGAIKRDWLWCGDVIEIVEIT